MKNYLNPTILLMIVILMIGCSSGQKKQYFLKFEEKDEINNMPKDIYIEDQKVGSVDEVILNSSSPTYKVTLYKPLPINSSIELTEMDLLGAQKLLLNKSKSKTFFNRNDTIVGRLKHLNLKIYKELMDSIQNSLQSGEVIIKHE